jgi:hypothetical protein
MGLQPEASGCPAVTDEPGCSSAAPLGHVALRRRSSSWARAGAATGAAAVWCLPSPRPRRPALAQQPGKQGSSARSRAARQAGTEAPLAQAARWGTAPRCCWLPRPPSPPVAALRQRGGPRSAAAAWPWSRKSCRRALPDAAPRRCGRSCAASRGAGPGGCGPREAEAERHRRGDLGWGQVQRLFTGVVWWSWTAVPFGDAAPRRAAR